MKSNREKSTTMLDYVIWVLMITILVLVTFLMPQIFSAFMDAKDLNRMQVMERENFSFKSPVEMTVCESLQQMMEALEEKESVSRTLYLKNNEVTDGELLEGVREAISIAVRYKLIPDISVYDIENHIVYAEYYNLSDNTRESEEKAFWSIRFSDYKTFDFTFRIDAREYIIYQAEIYCAEASEYMMQLMSDDKEVVAFFNGQFIEGIEAYFEAEGYDVLTDISSGDMVMMFGFERGEYAVYHTNCNDGYLSGEGLRWGFVPMTVAMEKGNAAKEWGHQGIVAYYHNLYGIEIYEESILEVK